MSGPPVARHGDLGSHGGTIITASGDTFCNGQGVARHLDTYACAVHGPNPILGCSGTNFVNGRGVVRIGDATACGAKIITGSPDTTSG